MDSDSPNLDCLGVLERIKGTRAVRAGFAALDPLCALQVDAGNGEYDQPLLRRLGAAKRADESGMNRRAYGLHRAMGPLVPTRDPRLLPLSRRTTVMQALRCLGGVIREYPSDSSSKRPASSVLFAAPSTGPPIPRNQKLVPS